MQAPSVKTVVTSGEAPVSSIADVEVSDTSASLPEPESGLVLFVSTPPDSRPSVRDWEGDLRRFFPSSPRHRSDRDRGVDRLVRRRRLDSGQGPSAVPPHE